MQYKFFIGRFQPFHQGHQAFVDELLKDGPVCVAIRDTKIAKDNPYTTKARKKMIRKAFPDKNLVKIITIPDITEVVYGRNVGYEVKEIRLDSKTEAISGTDIRNGDQKIYDHMDIGQ